MSTKSSAVTYEEFTLDFAWLHSSECGVMALGHNTFARMTESRVIHISLYSSVIVKLSKDKISVSVDGWDTPTTRRRIAQYLPDGFTINSKKGTCFITDTNNFSTSFSERPVIAKMSGNESVELVQVWDEALGDHIWILG